MFLILEFVLFGEKIEPIKIIGLALILAAPLVVVFSRKRRNSRRMEMRAAILLITYVLFATVSSEIAVRVGHQEHFITVFTFFLVGRGLSDIAISFIPKIRRRHHYIMEHDGAKYVTITLINKSSAQSQTSCTATASFSASPHQLSALHECRRAHSYLLIWSLFSIIWPVFGREKLRRRCRSRPCHRRDSLCDWHI